MGVNLDDLGVRIAQLLSELFSDFLVISFTKPLRKIQKYVRDWKIEAEGPLGLETTANLLFDRSTMEASSTRMYFSSPSC